MTVESLAGLFAQGSPSLEGALADIDAHASVLQRRYRRVVQQAVWGGFLALAFAYASICFAPNAIFLVGEAIGTLVMVAGIIEGLTRRHLREWILARHRAERLRLLRFAWLITPAHWDLPPEARPDVERALQQEVNATLATTESEMKGWCRHTHLPVVGGLDRALSPAFVDAMKRYYVGYRLNDQLGYFLDMAERREQLNAVTRILPAIGFATAVLLSFIQLVVEAFKVGSERQATEAGIEASQFATPERWLLFFILILPAAGAAARLLRTAFEFARNRQRFVMTAAELDRARGWLDVAVTPGDVAIAMAKAEHALEQEHRAWLELMLEAEWFG